MDNLSYIIGLNNGEGGGGASSWSDIDGKPFNTVGTGLTTTSKILAIDSTVVTDSDLATVATTGDYDDLTNKPTIPSISVTQTLQSGTAIADIDVSGVTTTLYAPAGGGSVDIDNKSIVKNQDDELETAVPLYSEIIASAYGPGLLLNGPVNDSDDSFTIEHDILSSGYLSFTESNDAYTVIASIDGVVYSGLWDSYWIESGWYGDYYSWHVNNNDWEFHIQNDTWGDGDHGQRFHIYQHGQECSVLDWLLIVPNDPDNEQYITEANVESYNYTWDSVPYTQTIYHKLPLPYTSIEACQVDANPLVYVDNGIMKIRKPSADDPIAIYAQDDELHIAANIPQPPLLNIFLQYNSNWESNSKLHVTWDNDWLGQLWTATKDDHFPVMIFINEFINGGDTINRCLYFEKGYLDNNEAVYIFKNSTLTLTLTENNWVLAGDITDSGTDWNYPYNPDPGL